MSKGEVWFILAVLSWCLLFVILFAFVFLPEVVADFYIWWLRWRYPYMFSD